MRMRIAVAVIGALALAVSPALAQNPPEGPGRPDSATREQMREHFRRIADEVRAVLTPDQQKVWDQNVAELRARRPGGP